MSLWTGIIDPQRATDWETTGVNIIGLSAGIPARTNPCTTVACEALRNGNAGTITSGVINAALDSAPANTVVDIPAGTFTLADSILFRVSNVTLRGAGPTRTMLNFTGASALCDDGYIKVIGLCTGVFHQATGLQNSGSWTGGYAKGTTVITLSSTTNLVVGSVIMLDQLDDTVTDGVTDGYPGAGDILMCGSTQPCSAEGSGAPWTRAGRIHVETHQVTAISGLNVTIDPPIHSPDFRAGQTPQAWWANRTAAPVGLLENSGIENLTYDFSLVPTTSGRRGLLSMNVANCWMKNVRGIRTGGPGDHSNHITLVQTFRFETRDSYFYGPEVAGNTQYAYSPELVGSCRFENNILHFNVSPHPGNDPDVGSVTAYNYFDAAHSSSMGVQLHLSGDLYNLYEGNNMGQFYSDIFHGTHHFHTLFRNHLDRDAHNVTSNSNNSAHFINTHSRFYNLIGNVMGHQNWTNYERSQADGQADIYNLGYRSNCGACGTIPNDPHVLRTLFRWGNWDSVTSTNPTGVNDATGTRFVAGENPSGITNFPNLVGPSTTLPPSFYLATQPAWWGTPYGVPPWPPIGPDVSSGDAPNTSATPTGGHANKIPARLCFENTPVDPAYQATSPQVRLFDGSVCYTGPGFVPPPTVPPVPPTAGTGFGVRRVGRRVKW